MGPISRWAVNKPKSAILAWVIAAGLIIVGVVLHAGAFNNSFALPGTNSQAATDLLTEDFGDEFNNGVAQVVFTTSAGNGTIGDPALQTAITNLANEISKLGSVASVDSPYAQKTPLDGLYAFLSSPNAKVGQLQVHFNVQPTAVPEADAVAIMNMVENLQATSTTITAGVQGQPIANVVPSDAPNEIAGIVIAIIIMLSLFGSVVAAGLPLMTAILGLAGGLGLLMLAANFTTMASFSPTLAVMIGLGVGFDYSLFIINRYRLAIQAGNEPRAAALVAVNTAGKAVVFAAVTVTIALCGLFVLGISFLNGLAVGAAVTVIWVMVTAVILLPAVVSLLGDKALSWKLPWGKKPIDPEGGPRFQKWSAIVHKRRWLFVIITPLIMIFCGIPALSMVEGFPDAGNNPPGNTQKIAYDLTAQGWGPGANGPFIVVTTLPNGQSSVPQANALSEAIGKTPGVAFVTPVKAGSAAVSSNSEAALMEVIPTTGPQDPATTDLLNTLVDTVIPQATAGTGLQAYVGGVTAVAADFSQVLASKLKPFLAIVVILGFIILMALFRSFLIPLTAVITSLLSFFAALGISVFVFQWGLGASLIGVYEPGPILPFVPVMLFAILFGLSMDYQVFLVSRMQEEWNEHHDNTKAVHMGLGGSGRVILSAAGIMFFVFTSFIFQGNPTIKLFGLSFGVAVALDALLMRLCFVPSLMSVLGRANWYIPKWLGKILPKFSVE